LFLIFYKTSPNELLAGANIAYGMFSTETHFVWFWRKHLIHMQFLFLINAWWKFKNLLKLKSNYSLCVKCDVCGILYKDSSFHIDPSKSWFQYFWSAKAWTKIFSFSQSNFVQIMYVLFSTSIIRFETRSGRIKNYKIGMCCVFLLSTKH
jgi:hypothetical protein